MGMPDFPRVVGTLNSSVTNSPGSIVAMDVAEASSVAISISGGAVAAAGVALVFEVSPDSTDGVNGKWHQVTAARTNANVAEAVVSAFGAAVNTALPHAWELTVVGWAMMRVRVTSLTSGELAVQLAASRAALDPAPVVASHGVTSTPQAGTSHKGVTTAAAPAGVLLSNAGTSLFELSIANTTSGAICVKLYDKATAPTVGTDVPMHTVVVDAFATPALQFGAVGKRFATGLGIAITAGPAATDTAAVGAGAQWSLTRI